jgi:predicted nucleic acid-binding protein
LSTLFVDTSALAKRYLSEVGSVWVSSVVAPAAGQVVIIASVTVVEMFSLLARRGREGTLAAVNITLLGNAFLLHAEREYLVVPLEGRVLVQARALIGKYPLRTLDAIQLANAQTAGAILGESITFISSDRNLLAAASAEGLLTDDPLMHP